MFVTPMRDETTSSVVAPMPQASTVLRMAGPTDNLVPREPDEP